MRFKRHLAWLFVFALIFALSGCSAPVATDSTSTEASVKIDGLPKKFPNEATKLLLDDAKINETREGSDGKTISVNYTTAKSLDDAKAFYAENMKGFENYAETPNEFGAVYEGANGDYSYTIAVTQVKDTPVIVVFTVY